MGVKFGLAFVLGFGSRFRFGLAAGLDFVKVFEVGLAFQAEFTRLNFIEGAAGAEGGGELSHDGHRQRALRGPGLTALSSRGEVGLPSQLERTLRGEALQLQAGEVDTGEGDAGGDRVELSGEREDFSTRHEGGRGGCREGETVVREEVMEGEGDAEEPLAAAGVGDDGGGVHVGVWPLTGGQAWGSGGLSEGGESSSESSESGFGGDALPFKLIYICNPFTFAILEKQKCKGLRGAGRGKCKG